MQKINFKKIFSLIGLLGVMLGAFGAHALKNHLSVEHIEQWKTATLYLFIHTLAGLCATHFCTKKRSSYFFLLGIFIFSGSLYTFSLTEKIFFVIATPFGGVLFILGWLTLALDS